MLLEKQIGLERDDAVKVVQSHEVDKTQLIDICRAMLSDSWSIVVSKYKALDNKDSEAVRRACLGYLKSCLLKSKKIADAEKFCGMIEELAENTYDSGEPKLVAMLFRANRVAKGD